MLTWSDWHTEPRSNRYHYATRFSKELPVVFVQPDSSSKDILFEKTEIKNLEILHLYKIYGEDQTRILNKALLDRGIIKPLLWIYNSYFSDFIYNKYAPLKIYHATEDYFSSDLNHKEGIINLRNKLLNVLSCVDLLIAVSDGVLKSYIQKGYYSPNHIILTNGCDFNFLAPTTKDIKEILKNKENNKTVLYQGGINNRLDFDLIIEAVSSLPDWNFWFCGEDNTEVDFKKWHKLCLKKNFKYFGILTPKEVKQLSYKATVGIIPFVQNDMIKISFPLKAFEYIACGLPVVSVPINSLMDYSEFISFAETADEFKKCIQNVASSRYDTKTIEKRIEIAKTKDYDNNFKRLKEKISRLQLKNRQLSMRLNILILYDEKSTHVNTLKEHLESFSLYSHHHIFYTIATHEVPCKINLNLFDVLIIHYSVRLSLSSHLSSSYSKALSEYGGLKILFIQDEYDTTEVARNFICKLGIHVVYTCVPNYYINFVYPLSRFPHVEFIQTLTGYVPFHLETAKRFKSLTERKFIIGYRGRKLPFWYGELGKEKLIIGKKMKKICQERGVISDIEWEDDKRIYGEAWYQFLEDCKATIGTESGSNIFDEYGEIKNNIEKEIKINATLTYNEAYEKYLKDYEGNIKMNQISPKIFEAIALKTALVLFEGEYSGIIKPNVHYIPLKKDFSNVDEVLDKLRDDNYLEELTNRTYLDIIKSGKYSHKQFILDFDQFVSRHFVKGKKVSLVKGIIGKKEHFENNIQKNIKFTQEKELIRSAATTTPLLDSDVNDISINISSLVRETNQLSRMSYFKELIAHKLSNYPGFFSVCRGIYRSVSGIFNRL